MGRTGLGAPPETAQSTADFLGKFPVLRNPGKSFHGGGGGRINLSAINKKIFLCI
jgi:hypothetical protein